MRARSRSLVLHSSFASRVAQLPLRPEAVESATVRESALSLSGHPAPSSFKTSTGAIVHLRRAWGQRPRTLIFALEASRKRQGDRWSLRLRPPDLLGESLHRLELAVLQHLLADMDVGALAGTGER